jgi:hypothetical protein
VLAAVSPLAGCYTTRPVTSAPVPGTTVVLDLTDRARVELGDRIGPSASRIEGIVQERNDTAYVLRVSSVAYLNGQSNKWAGESLTVPTTAIAQARLREFSRSRTTLIGAGIAAALAAVFFSTDFFGLSGPSADPLPLPGGET